MHSKDRQHRHQFSKFVEERARPGYKRIMNALNRRWKKCNQEFFKAEMIIPYIFLSEPTHSHVLGQYHPTSSFGAPAEIRIRPSLAWGGHPCVNKGKKFEKGRLLYVADVLLHEMVHQWQHEVIKNLEPMYSGHGPLFRDKCNEIGERLGLGMVRTGKARGKHANLPSCSHWPHNVRPAEFYCGANAQRQGLTPIGSLCRSASEFAENPNDLNKLLSLGVAAIGYTTKERFTTSDREKLFSNLLAAFQV